MITNLPSLDPIINNASQHMHVFQSLVTDIPYERKGILFSEMFFLWLLAQEHKPQRIFESGRARGQSTLILSHCFPDSEIISIEHDRNSPDVAIATERLQNRSNVQQLFGDSTLLLPKMVNQGDTVLIDGPKGYRGLRLALNLLGKNKPSMVFLHDAGNGTIERSFLSKYMPETLYSDDITFSGTAHSLDQGTWDELPEANRWTKSGAPSAGYGFCLACIPIQQRSYPWLLVKAVTDGLIHKIKRHPSRNNR